MESLGTKFVMRDVCVGNYTAMKSDPSQFTTLGCLLRKNEQQKRERDREDEI